jgi:hypothetical protein
MQVQAAVFIVGIDSCMVEGGRYLSIDYSPNKSQKQYYQSLNTYFVF